MYIQITAITLLLAASVNLATASPILPTRTVLVQPVTVTVHSPPTNYKLVAGTFTAIAKAAMETRIALPANLKTGNKLNVIAQKARHRKGKASGGTPGFPINFGHGPFIPGKDKRPLAGEVKSIGFTTIQSLTTPVPSLTYNLGADAKFPPSSATITKHGRRQDEDNEGPQRKLNKFGRIMFKLTRWGRNFYTRLTSYVEYEPFDKDDEMIDIGKLSPEELKLLIAIGQQNFTLSRINATILNVEEPKKEVSNWKRGWQKFKEFFTRKKKNHDEREGDTSFMDEHLRHGAVACVENATFSSINTRGLNATKEAAPEQELNDFANSGRIWNGIIA